MKKVAFLGFAIAFLGFLLVSTADAAVYVRGYYRSNGTYVAPHYRSNPDGNPYNNWSFPGNTNPYTGVTATGNPDTYLNNYYNNNSSSYSSFYSSLGNLFSPTTLPVKDVPYVVKLWVTNNPLVSCSDSMFLRAKEKDECEFYKKNKYSYTWNVTTNEYDGMHYRYDPDTQISYSCLDGLTILYDTTTGKPTESCVVESTNLSLPVGCTTSIGFSPISGLSCSNKTCAPGLVWNGNMCK